MDTHTLTIDNAHDGQQPGHQTPTTAAGIQLPTSEPLPFTNGNTDATFTINLSSHQLSEAQRSVLDKGLTYIPAYKQLPVDTIYASQDRLIRNLKLRDYFMGRSEDDYDYSRKTFTNPSTWTPQDHKLGQPTLDTVQRIVRATESAIRNHRIINNRFIALDNYRDNLTYDERRAIKELRNDRDIIIKPADKGSATVVMDKCAYVAEANRQLNNSRYYRKLEHPIFQNNVTAINEILEDLKQQRYITDQQYLYLQAKTTDRARIFYLLPKIHKPRSKWPQPNMPEGRPIVSDCGSESYRACEYINHFIRPISMQHRSYIKDTYDFVTKVRHQKIPKGAFLVTGDVTSLYTNMHIDRTMSVTRRALEAHPQSDRPDAQLLRLLELTLKNNDFVFNGQSYVQICGTAMGKSYAPALADLYMEEFDNRAMDGHDATPLLFHRFLDDIFFIWIGSLRQLLAYEDYLNNIIPGIKVTLNYSQESVNFLDTTIYKNHEPSHDTLLTRVYFKDTDTHQLLHPTSFHPRHTTRGILKSQLIRFKRISSSNADYTDACNTLFRVLAKRRYNKRKMRAMRKQIWETQNVEPQRNDNTNGTLLPIVVPFNEIGTRLALTWKSIICDNGLFQDLRLISAYTCGRHLKQILVRSSLEPAARQHDADDDDGNAPPGCNRCTSNRCRACNYVTVGQTCRSTTNNREFVVRGNITCKTSNVVYVITCIRCKLQYVGQTSRTLADRINDHLSRIRTTKNTPVGLHFNRAGHTLCDFSIMGVERIYNTRDTLTTLFMKERTWQNLLQSAYPYGLNNLKAGLLSTESDPEIECASASLSLSFDPNLTGQCLPVSGPLIGRKSAPFGIESDQSALDDVSHSQRPVADQSAAGSESTNQQPVRNEPISSRLEKDQSASGSESANQQPARNEPISCRFQMNQPTHDSVSQSATSAETPYIGRFRLQSSHSEEA